MEYIARLTAPAKDNKYYYSDNNIYYASGVGMPNCTAYVWGRLYELTGIRYTELTGNGEDMYINAAKAGLKTSTEPRLGSLICWQQGATGDDSDGAGHIAVVEQILDNGDLICSQSHCNGVEFDLLTAKATDNYKYKDGYTLQGFIHSGIIFSTREEDLVRRTYIDILCREPDSAGLKNWAAQLKKGMSEDTFRQNLLNSQEYHTDPNKYQLESYIIKCYRIILGRYPENNEILKHWKTLSKDAIFNGIWNSREAHDRRNKL